MFSWVAAGSGHAAFGSLSLFVRYKNRVGGFQEGSNSSGFLLKLKDREIFLTRPGLRDYNLHLPQGGWDFCVDCDMLGFDSAVKHTGIMYCYESRASKRKIAYDTRQTRNNGLIFGDSAGFKLAVETEEFIDPRDLAAWYNKYVNLGMTLDIPPYWGSPIQVIERAAKYQKANTRIILDNLNSDVILYNVSHGHDEESRKRYLDLVQDDRLDRWAIGGAYYGNPFDFLYNILLPMELADSKTFHVFGVAGTSIIPLLAWMGRYYNLTSDSSSHLQSARGAVFFMLMGYQLKKIGLGRSKLGSLQTSSVNPWLSCSCPICTALGSSEIYYNASPNVVAYILALHNINAMARYSQLWASLSLESDLKTYKSAISKSITGNPKQWHHALDYIEACNTLGVKAASRKYRALMSTFMQASLTRPSSWTFLSAEENAEFQMKEGDESRAALGSEDKKESVSTRHESYMKVLDRYKSYHQNEYKREKRKKPNERDKEKRKLMGIRSMNKKKVKRARQRVKT